MSKQSMLKSLIVSKVNREKLNYLIFEKEPEAKGDIRRAEFKEVEV